MLPDWSEFLSSDDIERIHDTSMEILSDVGVRFPDNEAIALFKQHGVKTDGRTVYLDERQLMEALARAIPAEDDEVDKLYGLVYRELMTFVAADQSAVEQANYLLWVAHNLERTADRVTNICERVIFTVTGELVELDVEDSGVESVR